MASNIALGVNVHNSAPIPISTNLNTNYNDQLLFENIGITVGAVIVSAMLSVLFYWVYGRNKFMFISLLFFFLFLYGLMTFGGFFMIRRHINQLQFRIYAGAASVVILTSLVVGLGFAFAGRKGNSSSDISIGGRR